VATAAGPTAERRLVSVLFADLVGFTTLSEQRDAEEVREILSGYFERMRAVVERHGGVVEKFIGDAVVAVWGTPVAHEDDAERAVRSALSLIDSVAQLGDDLGLPPGTLSLRVGVMTGEAAVTVGATGQGMVAGDMVNTASRIQSAAPPGSVLVGESTRRASESAIAYEEMTALDLKGKSAPVAVWRAVRVVAARGGARRADTLEAPWVGREIELRLVRDLFHVCADQKTSHLVSVLGIAGIGKSRLSWEFEKYIDGLADTILWHRGRCLAYGEGVTYWALAEMIRMRCGIAEEEDQASARAKLGIQIERWIPDAEQRSWVGRALAHLIGTESGPPPGADELYAAWRAFFESMAGHHPVVLVFEDLQWADSALLGFIDHLLDWSRNVPMLIVGLSRPEFSTDTTDGWRNVTSLHLGPLGDPDMDRLVRGLVPGIPDEVAEQIRSRAEGVPLYAVETVRMLLDRGLITRDASSCEPAGPIDSLDVPESLHGLIAARLDGLPQPERKVLSDASVLGKTFTVHALEHLTGQTADQLAPILRSLVHKEMLFVQGDVRSPERGQYGFLQALVREVTYAILSKRDRKARHLAAARYLESERLDDEEEIVEVVASHFLEAYAAEPSAEDAPEIKAKARDLLTRAGERAMSLAAPARAAAHFGRALDLGGEPLEQASLYERAGDAARTAGFVENAAAHFERSMELFSGARRESDAARVSARLAEVQWDEGRIDEGVERMERSFQVLSTSPPDDDLATLAAQLGRLYFFTGDLVRSRERVDFALGIAERLFLPEVLSNALNTKSLVLNAMGRIEESKALLRHALTLAKENGASGALLRAYYNSFLEGPGPAIEYARLGLELARRLGNRYWELNFLGRQASVYWLEGRWDEALDVVGPVLDQANAHASGFSLSRVLPAITHVLVNRGHLDQAEKLVALRESAAAAPGMVERADYYTALAMVTLARGDLETSKRARSEMLAVIDRVGMFHETTRESITATIEISLAAGDIDEAARLLEDIKAKIVSNDYLTPALARIEPLVAAARGDDVAAEEGFRRAQELTAGFGTPFSEGATSVEFAEWLAERGRVIEAKPLLERAAEIFQRLTATPWLERIERVRSAP
jgi:class 3 adenylate cyclase/tetratricopeptide (TPR) repeat protein